MRVIVVGAGLAGLSAAGPLVDAGHDVILFDKGRSVGGRLATRRIGDATLDHGAQFFTVRSEAFAALIAPHQATGLVYEWCRGFAAPASTETDGYPRYAVHGGMNAWAKAIAAPLAVRTGALVFSIRRAPAGVGRPWQVTLDDGSVHDADALVVTAPIPQSYSLLVSAGVELPSELIRTEYDRTIALLATLDRPSAVRAPGGIQHPTAQLSFVTDNVRKGISRSPALTVHASADWSESHWGDDVDTLANAITAAAAPFIGDAAILAAQVKKWRFATPRTIWPERCWTSADAAAPLVLAGDAFGGPKVEGAVLSGCAAAEILLA